MKETQEPKYDCNEFGQIYTRASGEAIPDEEPVFIFRARDIHALHALYQYAARLDIQSEHFEAVKGRIRDFQAFENANPYRMKKPDTDLG